MNEVLISFAVFLSKTQSADFRLIKKFLSGDRQAESDLHQAVNDLIEKGIRALEAKGSYFSDRQNVKQDILVKILVKDQAEILRRYGGKSRLSTYLWSVIRFKLIDALRKEMNISSRYRKLDKNIEQIAQGKSTELFELIEEFLNRLPKEEAVVLRMRWLENLNYESICTESAKHGVNVNTTYIGNLLFRTRKKLLEYLKNRGYKIDIQM